MFCFVVATTTAVFVESRVGEGVFSKSVVRRERINKRSFFASSQGRTILVGNNPTQPERQKDCVPSKLVPLKKVLTVTSMQQSASVGLSPKACLLLLPFLLSCASCFVVDDNRKRDRRKGEWRKKLTDGVSTSWSSYVATHESNKTRQPTCWVAPTPTTFRSTQGRRLVTHTRRRVLSPLMFCRSD